jgi:glycosyltransferase involved in cell wall biosynthesis
VAYKRLDSAIRVCAATGRRLRIVGDGPEYKALRRIANANVEFCGKTGDADLRDLYSRCRAFLMPGEEDFGITAVEALASGKPVIALGRGGALETVPLDVPQGGIFFPEPTDASLLDAMEHWEQRENQLQPPELQAWAAQFSEAEFARKMRAILFPLSQRPLPSP